MANLKYKHTAYTSTQWASLNPVIVENEIVIESDTKRTKIGNGISTYNQLEYADANSIGNSLGSIKPTDAAPTPARNGNYTFSIGGNKPAWLTAEEGVTTVKAGDGVAVVYDGVSTYTYTHVDVSIYIEQVRSQATNKVASSKLLDDELNSNLADFNKEISLNHKIINPSDITAFTSGTLPDGSLFGNKYSYVGGVFGIIVYPLSSGIINVYKINIATYSGNINELTHLQDFAVNPGTNILKFNQIVALSDNEEIVIKTYDANALTYTIRFKNIDSIGISTDGLMTINRSFEIGYSLITDKSLFSIENLSIVDKTVKIIPSTLVLKSYPSNSPLAYWGNSFGFIGTVFGVNVNFVDSLSDVTIYKINLKTYNGDVSELIKIKSLAAGRYAAGENKIYFDSPIELKQNEEIVILCTIKYLVSSLNRTGFSMGLDGALSLSTTTSNIEMGYNLMVDKYDYELYIKSKSTLYSEIFTNTNYPSVTLNAGVASANGITISTAATRVRLNKYYSLEWRSVLYLCTVNGACVFRTDKTNGNNGGTLCAVDTVNKKISIYNNTGNIETPALWLTDGDLILVELKKESQKQTFKISSVKTGDSATVISYCFGNGPLGNIEGVGSQNDFYEFGVGNESSSLTVKKMVVKSLVSNPEILIYGDSITEPLVYYPQADIDKSWTYLFRNATDKKIQISGRGGTTINELYSRIKNELLYIRSKYVMITIGTNGGNTEENLSNLIDLIIYYGSIPILNHIPCNESGTQIAVNSLIDTVRAKYNIIGANFDLCTSLNYDGVAVNTNLMYAEAGGVYHHPNVDGSTAMFNQLQVDLPFLF